MPPERLRELWAVGEVGLDARIKQVRGVLAMLHAANQSAFRSYLIPFENLGEGLAVGKTAGYGRLQPGRSNGVCKRVCAGTGTDAAGRGRQMAESGKRQDGKRKKTPDFALLCGMEEAKRAAMIAAAGAHNLLFWQDRPAPERRCLRDACRESCRP